jgi:transposase
VPYTHYGWAPKNTKPKIFSDERNRKKINGFLAVDAQRGTTNVEFNQQSTHQEIALFIVFIALFYLQHGINHITFLLDNARIHGKLMEEKAQELLTEIGQQIELPSFTILFWHTPAYSPDMNPAEYVIHLIRQKGLYQVPCTFTVEEKAQRIRNQLLQGSPMNEKQMLKLTKHIGKIKDKF